jgi:hypothetical protein
MELDPQARRVVVVWELGTALIASFALSPWVALVYAAVIGAWIASWRILTRRQAGARTPTAYVPSPSESSTAHSA